MNISSLPNDIVELKALVVKLSAENFLLKDQLFGAKSEKRKFTEDKQGRIFDEAEVEIEKLNEPPPEIIEVKTYKRKKKGRKPINEDIPRKEIIHDIPEEDKTCACGCKLSKIGEKTSEKLVLIPESVIVERHIRLKYACKECEGTEDENKPTVRIAPVPKQLFPKSIVTPSLISYILSRKFALALPLYRLESLFKGLGIHIPRASMAGWVIKSYFLVNRLHKLMAYEARSGPLVGIDETTVQVLNERGRDPTSKSYMWVVRGSSKEKPIILFRYRRGRSTKFLRRYLKDYKGIIQSDGFSSYDTLVNQLNVSHAGCWAHARRKFIELEKTSSRSKVANIAIKLIKQLYQIEKEAKENELGPNEIKELRKLKSKPVINKIKRFLDKRSNVPPKSPLGKAVTYCW